MLKIEYFEVLITILVSKKLDRKNVKIGELTVVSDDPMNDFLGEWVEVDRL